MERAELDELIRKLTDPTGRVLSRDFPGPLTDLELPGLYAWWVNSKGAADLAAGLGHPIFEGLVYAGQTGRHVDPVAGTSSSVAPPREYSGLDIAADTRGNATLGVS